MNDEQPPIHTHGEKEAVMDVDLDDLGEFERFVTWALTGIMLPRHRPEEDALLYAIRNGGRATVDRVVKRLLVEVEDTDAPVPDSVESGLSSLEQSGKPEESAHQMFSRIPDDTPYTWAHGQGPDDTHLNTRRDGPKPSEQDPAAFRQLTETYKASPRNSQVAWNCQYRVLGEIGRGGQGVVYLIDCLNEFSGKRALKVLAPTPYANADDYEADMQRMAAVAAVVDQSWHNNLLQIERFEPQDGIYFMVMRLVDGYDLQHLLEPKSVSDLKNLLTPTEWGDFGPVVFGTCSSQRCRLQPGVAVNIIQQCLRGVSALHDKDIIHCDIKPSNIMIDSYGAIRLIDFCSAYHLSSPPSQRAWTPRYAPPEVLLGGEGTPQSDLASLGYVLIEFLTGRPDVLVTSLANDPLLASESLELDSVYDLDKKTREKLAEVKRQLPDRLTDLIPSQVRDSARLIHLCRKLIAWNPEKRFSNADEAIWNGTHDFQSELHNAKPKLAVFYAEYMKRWLRAMKRAEAANQVIQ